jgi:hypothetical protein
MSAYKGPFFDVDVHQRLKVDTDILEFLPSEWHEYALGDGSSPFQVIPPYAAGVISLGTAMRDDAIAEDGSKWGSDYETMRKQLLDPRGDYRAVLTHQLGEFGCHFNQYYSRVLSSAMNDWAIEKWLKRDERLFATIVTPLAEPEEAAKEIRRVGAHPQVLGVLVAGNMLGRPIGDPLYEPIFEAADELGLRIFVHLSPVAVPHRAAIASGGRIGYLPLLSQLSQQAMHYMSSLVVHGVFERHPSLKVLFLEFGIGWLPYALWRMDAQYPLLKKESPWVKRLPSEYVRSNILFSTQPLEEDFDDHGGIFDLLGTIDGVEDMLCYASDYPHGTMDEPEYMARRLPESWRDKVLHENATKAFGLRPMRTNAVPAAV